MSNAELQPTLGKFSDGIYSWFATHHFLSSFFAELKNMNLLNSVVFSASLAASAIAFAGSSEYSDSIVRSAASGDITQLKSSLTNGGNANAVDGQGNSALYYAVLFNHVDVASLLLESGASGINDLYQFTPERKNEKYGFVSYASANRNRDMLNVLLKHGADVNLLDESGDNALPMAVSAGDTDIVTLLLTAGIDPNRRLKGGFSATALALMNNNIKVLEILLDSRADVDWRDDYGSSLLMLAVDMGNVDAVKLLLNRRAKVYPSDAHGLSALSIAKSIQNFVARDQIVSMLKTAGANDGNGMRLVDLEFLVAVRNGDLPKVTALLNKGADLHARGRPDGRGPLTNALELSVKHPKICSLLLEKGINPFMKNTFDFTALHAAARDGGAQVISVLVAKGLDPNARSRSGMSPMYLAINGNPKPTVVEALLRAGADPDGPTPIRGQNMIQFSRSVPNSRITAILEAANTK